MALRYYSNAQGTTLTAAVSAVSNSIQVASTAGLPINYPFVLILDRGTASEEVVLCTNATGSTLTVTRGYDSTATFVHAAGATVEHGIAAIDAREANTHVNATSGVHGVTSSLVGTSDAQSLTNKTIGSTNVLNGFPASQVIGSDSAGRLVGTGSPVPTGNVVGTSAAQTLTNKTIALGANAVSGTLAEFSAACTDADFATTATSQTFQNKTFPLLGNALTGTVAQFNNSVTDDDFASLNGAQTLANKTLSSPTITTPTVTSPTITGGTLSNTGGTFTGTASGPSTGVIKPGNTTSINAIDFGLNSVTVNGSGQASVAHGCGRVPTAVVATMALNGAVQMRVSVIARTATDFTVELRNSSTNDTATGGNSYSVQWIAIA